MLWPCARCACLHIQTLLPLLEQQLLLPSTHLWERGEGQALCAGLPL